MSPDFRYHTALYSVVLQPVPEDIAALEARCLPSEVRQAAQFVSESRRREWLAWHALLQELLPGAVAEYDRRGAPRLCGRYAGRCLSVSHARGAVAVMLSDRPCGIDVEETGRCFDRARSRFVSPEEERFVEEGDNRTLARLWCAKEALYKWGGVGGITLRDDIRITEVTPDGAFITPADGVRPAAQGKMAGSVRRRPCRLAYVYTGGYCLTWTEDEG